MLRRRHTLFVLIVVLIVDTAKSLSCFLCFTAGHKVRQTDRNLEEVHTVICSSKEVFRRSVMVESK